MSHQHPSQWILPNWSNINVDPTLEMSMLRECSTSILRVIPDARLELCHIDEGYMYVAVNVSGVETHIYIIERGVDGLEKWFGVFKNVNTDRETECYFQTSEKVIKLLVL
ncbi:MAG: hypothetical protein ACKVH8_06330 [Pirellulales bacterium]